MDAVTSAIEVTQDQKYDPRYDLFFERLAEYANAKKASDETFPERTWTAIYKRIKRDPELYSRYRAISSAANPRRVRNRINTNAHTRTQAFRRVFEKIATGTPVKSAIQSAFSDQHWYSVLLAIHADESLSYYYAEARQRRDSLVANSPDAVKRRRERVRARRIAIRNDPTRWQKYTEQRRAHNIRRRQHKSWRVREKLMKLARIEAKARGIPSRQLWAEWGIPSAEQWKQAIDYSDHNLTDEELRRESISGTQRKL